MMTQWEYLTVLLEANMETVRPVLERAYPQLEMGPFSPLALMPRLNELGAEGWELISATPCKVGDNHDILVSQTGAILTNTWTSTYLCLMKRPKPA